MAWVALRRRGAEVSVPAGVLAGPFLLAAGLLVPSGASKLIRPGSGSRAMASAALPSGPVVVRVVGLAELGVAAWCLFLPSAAAAVALAVLYLAFGAFLVRLIRRAPDATSCGCLGATNAPPTRLHVAFDLVAVAVGAAAVPGPPPSLPQFLRNAPLVGVPVVLGLLTAGYLLYLAVLFLPELFFSFRPEPHEAHAAPAHAHPETFEVGPLRPARR